MGRYINQRWLWRKGVRGGILGASLTNKQAKNYIGQTIKRKITPKSPSTRHCCRSATDFVSFFCSAPLPPRLAAPSPRRCPRPPPLWGWSRGSRGSARLVGGRTLVVFPIPARGWTLCRRGFWGVWGVAPLLPPPGASRSGGGVLGRNSRPWVGRWNAVGVG